MRAVGAFRDVQKVARRVDTDPHDILEVRSSADAVGDTISTDVAGDCRHRSRAYHDGADARVSVISDVEFSVAESEVGWDVEQSGSAGAICIACLRKGGAATCKCCHSARAHSDGANAVHILVRDVDVARSIRDIPGLEECRCESSAVSVTAHASSARESGYRRRGDRNGTDEVVAHISDKDVAHLLVNGQPRGAIERRRATDSVGRAATAAACDRRDG